MKKTLTALLLLGVCLAPLAAKSEFVWKGVDSEFRIFKFIDDMTQVVDYRLTSGFGSPIRVLDFPYAEAKSTLLLRCMYLDPTSHLNAPEALVAFIPANLLNDGENIKSRIRVDDRLHGGIDSWITGDFLAFDKGSGVLGMLSNSKRALFEVEWYDEGDVPFEISLVGFDEAVSKLRKLCAMK